jgi:hypothetical protein
MKNLKKLLILLLILLGIAAAFFYFNSGSKKPASQSPAASQTLKTILSVDEESFDISSFIGKSALEATMGSIKVEESGSGQNAFVTAINDKTADSNKHEFWELVINGKPAEVGAGSYIIQTGDSILWRLNTY